MKITEEMMKNGGVNPEVPETPKQPKQKLTEREKLCAMSRKDKIWYIFTYYKFHMLAVCIGVILLYTAGITAYRMSFHSALHCIYINSRSEEETNLAPMEDGFAAWKELGKKEKVYVETSFISYGEEATEYSIANLEKISALVSAGDLDVMIGDKENIDHFAQAGGFLDLEEVMPESFVTAHMNRFYYTEGPDGELHAYGAEIGGLPFTVDSVLVQEPPIFGIISNSERADTAAEALRYIFEYQ